MSGFSQDIFCPYCDFEMAESTEDYKGAAEYKGIQYNQFSGCPLCGWASWADAIDSEAGDNVYKFFTGSSSLYMVRGSIMAKLYYYKWSTKTGDTKYAFATDDHYIVAEIETEPQENNLQYSFIPLREVEARRRRN